MALPRLRACWANEKSGVIRGFLTQVENVQAAMTAQIKALLAKGKIVFPALWFIFEQGCQIYSWKDGCKIGASVIRSDYVGSFQMTGEMIKCDGQQFYYVENMFTIPYFNGVKLLADLEVQMMDPQTMDELIER